MRRAALLLITLAGIAALAAGCSTSTRPGMGTVRVMLTDAPAAYDSVVLAIRDVAIHTGAADSSGDWTTFTPAAPSYDLLQLRNGVFATLGQVMVPAGHYTQVRLRLNPGSYVVENGVRRDLTVPSGLQTGLKLIGEYDVPAGGNVDLGIDFDAARSIHATGSGVLMLKPTVKVEVIRTTGSIAGTVAPASPASTVRAISGADTIATAFPDTSGAFRMSLLPPGLYDVAIQAPAGWRDTTLAGVSVTVGQTTSVGLVQLTAQ